jgi:hypothetical protein
MILWFKNAARSVSLDRAAAHEARGKGDFIAAAKLDAGAVFSEGIARITHGKYSHVQCSDDIPTAPYKYYSFGCVEPDGAVLMPDFDYSDRALWDGVTIPTTAVQDWGIMGWARGRLGRGYDYKNIAGIALGEALCSPADDICSRYAVELLQWQVAPDFLKAIKNACLVPPSGVLHGNTGLFELATAAGYKPVP